MSQESSSPQNEADPTKLFEGLLPKVPGVVHQAYCSLGYPPSPVNIEELTQQVIFLLLDRDYHKLRSFNRRGPPRAWLFGMVRHYLIDQRRKQIREVSLESYPPGGFSLQPEQERALIVQEEARQLSEAVSRLTAREQKLFRLLCTDGLSATERGKEMGIKRESVYRERIALIEKIGRVIRNAERK